MKNINNKNNEFNSIQKYSSIVHDARMDEKIMVYPSKFWVNLKKKYEGLNNSQITCLCEYLATVKTDNFIVKLLVQNEHQQSSSIGTNIGSIIRKKGIVVKDDDTLTKRKHQKGASNIK